MWVNGMIYLFPNSGVACKDVSMKLLPRDRRERCALFSAHFDYLSQRLVKSYIDDKKAVGSVESLSAYLKSKPDVDDEHVSNILYQHMLSMALSDSKRVSTFMKEYAELLSDEEMAILSAWRDRPAFFLLFTIVEQRESDLFVVEELFGTERYLVQSQGLGFMQKKEETRKKHYLTLMYDNGLCLETANLLHYASATKEELRFFFNALDAKRFAQEGVDGVLKAHPEGLSLYRRLANDYLFDINGTELKVHFAEVGALDYHFDEESWDVEKKGRMRAYTLVEPDDQMDRLIGEELMDHCCARQSIKVFSLKERTLLVTLDERSFAVGKTIFGLGAEIAATAIGLVVLFVVERERLMTPWFPFILFDEQDEVYDEDEEMAALNAMMAHYIEVTNRGALFDVEREAARFGVAVSAAHERIARFKEMLQRQFWSVPEHERRYEIADCPMPPPILRQDFSDSLSVSERFVLDWENIEEMEMLADGGEGRYERIIDVEDLVMALEEGFVDIFEDDEVGHFSLNMLLLITLSSNKPRLVRSLALEIYKIYPRLNKLFDFDRYVELFSQAVISHLVLMRLYSVDSRPRGEVRTRGLYTIQTTAPLRVLIKPTSVDIG